MTSQLMTFFKQPDEILDYLFDFSTWMPTGDSISSATVTADTGLTVGAKTVEGSNTQVRQFLSGGTDGTVYGVSCQIVTAQGRTKDKNILIVIEDL